MSSDLSRGDVRARLRWPADAATHRKIRRLWQRHSIAEDRRDIDGLIATLSPTCVYEMVGMGLRVPAHEEEVGLDLAQHGEVAYQG